jgi:hypothetical protein
MPCIVLAEEFLDVSGVFGPSPFSAASAVGRPDTGVARAVSDFAMSLADF